MTSSETHQPRATILRIPKRPFVDNLNTEEESKRARIQASSSSNKRPARPVMETVRDSDRPAWPSNGITAEASLHRITALERGDENEKLMAMFARHVINPGRHRYHSSKWVSKRSLRKAFPEHFADYGFLMGSAWATKSAEEFGLPDLFLRGVDERRAKLQPTEDIDDMFADVGTVPAVNALTVAEIKWLEGRADNQAVMSTASLQSEGERFDWNSDPDYTSITGGLRLTKKEFVESQAEERPEDMDTDRQRSATYSSVINTGRIQELEELTEISNSRYTALTSNSERPVGLEHSPRTTTSIDDGHFRETRLGPPRQTATEAPQTDASTTNLQNGLSPDVKESAAPSTPNDSQAAMRYLTTKISEILRDFPTSHENAAFIPLLRILVKSAISGDTEAIEDALLELETHVVTNAVNKPLTNQDEMALLVKSILRALRKLHLKDSESSYSEDRKIVNRFSIGGDLDGLRNMHAEILIWEARSEEHSP